VSGPDAVYYATRLRGASHEKARRELGFRPRQLMALGYRQVDFTPLAPADGYLAVFIAPSSLPAPTAIIPCRR
jgi:hypothetical protein